MQKLAVVYFPKINDKNIDTFRQKYDHGWKIIPPHITIVSPISDLSEDQLTKHVKSTIRDIQSFSIRLTGLVKTSDGHLFLQVSGGLGQIWFQLKRHQNLIIL